MEGSFLFIAFSDSDVVVSPTNVKLHEVLGTAKFVNEFRDQWQWVSILNSHLIELAVVLYRSESAILFLDEEEGRGKWRLGGLNAP